MLSIWGLEKILFRAGHRNIQDKKTHCMGENGLDKQCTWVKVHNFQNSELFKIT